MTRLEQCVSMQHRDHLLVILDRCDTILTAVQQSCDFFDEASVVDLLWEDCCVLSFTCLRKLSLESDVFLTDCLANLEEVVVIELRENIAEVNLVKTLIDFR